MICPHCHAQNRDSAKFCDECGTRLNGEGIPGKQASLEVVELEPKESIEKTGKLDRIPEIMPVPAVEEIEEAEESEEIIAHASEDDLEAEFADAEIASGLEADELDAESNAEDEDEAGDDCQSDENTSEYEVSTEDADAAELDGESSEAVEDASSEDAGRTGVLDIPEIAPASPSAETRKIDLSGFDEYVPEGMYRPAPSWRDGGTLEMPRIEEEASGSSQKSFVAPKEKSGRGKKAARIAAIVVLVLALCGAAAALVTYQMELWGGKVVPDVVGMTQADATNTLTSKGFTVRTTQVKSDETEGIVLLMDPGSGSRLAEGEEVVIHTAVSRAVPEILGVSQEEAAAAMEAEGLSNVNYVTQRSDEAAGTVLSVDPEPGTRVRSSTAITVTVAEPYTVPDISGMSYDDAAAAITDAGLTPVRRYVYREDVEEGSVVGSEPAAGEIVTSGSEVAIQVALSRETELINATYSFLASGNVVVIDGVSYDIVSCDGISYLGNETTAYTITASPFTYFLGVKVPLDARIVTGSIVWNADNTVAGGTPSISAG